MKNIPKSLFLALFYFCTPDTIFAQCTNETQNPPLNLQVPYVDTMVNLSTTTQAGQYLILEELVTGQAYQFSSSNTSDYFTIQNLSNGLLIHGTSPLTYNVLPGSNIIRVHVNTPMCGSESIPRTISLFCATCDPDPPKVGINTSSPVTTLDVNGTLKLGSSVHTAVKGMVRWNDTSSDFEGYNGVKWLSLTKSSNQWGNLPQTKAVESSKIFPNDGGPESEFGNSVSINGDYAIVGSEAFDNGSSINEGAAYIYKRIGSEWIQKAKLVANDGADSDLFGHSVAIEGEYAIVSAFTANIGMNEDQGAAYVFKRTGETWNQQAKLIAADGTPNTNFGSSLAISGSRVIVGAQNAEAGIGGAKGAAYIFERVGSTWSQQTKLIASDGADHDGFGASVALIGDEAFVGAPFYDIEPVLMEDTLTENQGAVYQFKRISAIWEEENVLIPFILSKDSQFGTSIAFDTDDITIGAIGEDVYRGAAYFFIRNGGTWEQVTRIAFPDLQESDNLGSSVAISDGYAVICANGKNAFKGAAYIFKKIGNSWVIQSELSSMNGLLGDNFGYSVGMTNNHIIIGAKDENFFSGATYIFEKN
jgi:hypothetical protein